MNRTSNKAATPNRRPRIALMASFPPYYPFCAPPASLAAVGEPHRSATRETMKVLFILGWTIWVTAAVAADPARPNLDLRSTYVAKERVSIVSSTNNISVFVPLKAEPCPAFIAFVRTNTVYPKLVSISVDGVGVAEAASLAPIGSNSQITGVVLLFFGKHRGDAERIAKVLRRS
jgi:hypothetical protein